jgi:adenylyl-sulfate kinase
MSDKNNRGFTIWFTGLSSSGKTTISKALEGLLPKYFKRPVYVIDGDTMRQTINKDLGFEKKHRNIATERIAYVARILNDNGVTCIVSNISQDNKIRSRVRCLIEEFVLVYVNTPPKICAERDYKGHWENALSGRLDNFVGVTDKYEVPEDSEVEIDTLVQDPSSAANIIVQYLRDSNFLK